MTLEHGLQLCFVLRLAEFLMHQTKRTVEVYETLEDLVSGISASASPNVELKNTQTLFSLFVGFLTIITLVQLLEWSSFRRLQTHRQNLLPLLASSAKLVQAMLFGKVALSLETAKSNSS